MACKDKFRTTLSRHVMNNIIGKYRLKQVVICYCMITFHACDFLSKKRRKGDSSIIAVSLEWDFESECNSSMCKYNKSFNIENLRLASPTTSSMPIHLC